MTPGWTAFRRVLNTLSIAWGDYRMRNLVRR